MAEQKNIAESFRFVAGFVVVMWIVFILNVLTPFFDFNILGIRPRNPGGLVGIVASPFLHGSLVHIISNTVPLFVLMLILFIFYEKIAIQVLCIIYFGTGLLVWIAATNAIHIGASGVVYGLAGFLFVIGFFRKDFKSIVISVVVILLYGGLVWGILPVRGYISWESHLFGALTGVFAAYISRKQGHETKRS